VGVSIEKKKCRKHCSGTGISNFYNSTGYVEYPKNTSGLSRLVGILQDKKKVRKSSLGHVNDHSPVERLLIYGEQFLFGYL